MKILIIGAGAAGSAAAWQAASGAEVSVVHSTASALELSCGAFDWDSWGAPSPRSNSDVSRFITDLRCWDLGPALLVSNSGQLRWADAADHALLDVTAVAGKVVGVVDLGRYGYDAKAWANALNQSQWAIESHTRFEAVEPVLPAPAAVRYNDYDFAAVHDEEANSRALGDALAAANNALAATNKRCQAWLLPPSLGVTEPVRAALEQRLGVTVGECMSMPAGPAGVRFSLARDRMFNERAVQRIHARVEELKPNPEGGWQVSCLDAEGARHSLETQVVILACGGLVGGGVQLGQPRLGNAAAQAFSLSVGSDAAMTLHGQRLDQVASLHGFDVQQNGASSLEQVGLLAVAARVIGFPGLFAAGEVVAAGPRSALGAIESGLKAAQQALLHSV